MTTSIITSTTDSQMHNNIMAASLRDRPPMLAPGRYSQWQSHFLRYIDTRPNGDALRKCLLEGLYQPTTVTILAVPAIGDNPAIPKRIAVETILNMSPKNKEHYQAEKEAIYLLLTGIGDDIYSTVDACKTAHEMWIAIERLNLLTFKMSRLICFGSLENSLLMMKSQWKWSRFLTIVKQQQDLDKVSYHKLFDILKQYQKEVNEIRAERIAKNANPLALVASAQQYTDSYYQAPQSHKSIAQPSKQSSFTRSHASTKNKDKEIAKPITPPSESASEEDSDPKQAQKDKEINKNVDTTPRYKNDNQTGQFEHQRTMTVAGARETVGSLVVKQSGIQCFNSEKGVPLQAEKYDWLEDTNEVIDEQELEAHYSYMAKIQEVPTTDLGTDSEPLEQNDQNDVVCDDERVALAILIANLKLDVDENKKILKQLKKVNTTLAHELTECKSILAETSRSVEESNSIQDSCLVALHNKQTELEKYKTFIDRTVDYEKLELKLNETLGLLAQKDIDIKEGLKLKAYKISVVLSKRKQVITDLKLKEEKDIDKMISREKQLKFLNEIVYKRNQSIQTIHMLAPKCLNINEETTFANPMYIKKAQYEKPCLYEIPHDQSDPTNRLIPDREEIPTLEVESRSKLNKDLVKPFDYTKELVDQAWVKHLQDHLNLRALTTHDMQILIKTCLMPLAIKIQNDTFTFVHELKQEMHADLKYVESFENEIDELESDKAEFSNMYDILLQKCMSNDVVCSYLHSLSDLDAHNELQCLYLYKVKECECLAQKLLKQTESVSKEVYTKLLRSFSKLEKHSITLELALQQCQEQMKNDTVCKEKESNVFLKEREQYFKIQDLKAQLQDKNISISELKKLIEKCKGMSVETKFDKPSVVRQPNALRISKPSVLGKLAPFLDSFERKSFSQTKSVPKTNVSESLSKPVTTQILPQTARQAVRNTHVIKPGMYQINIRTTQTRAPQFPQTSRNTNPRVVPNNSQVKDKKTEVEDHPRISSISNKTKFVTACNDNLKSKTLNVNSVCATCGKCVFNSNHGACVSKFLNDMNARTKKPKLVPISTRKPKSQANKSIAAPPKKIVALESTIHKSKSYYRMLYEKISKAWKWWIEQQCLSGYKWVPKTKMKWVPKTKNNNVKKRVSFAIDNVSRITNIFQLILFIVDFGCTKHMMCNLKLLCIFIENYLRTVRFDNDQFALILGYGDLVQGNITINRGNDLLTGNSGSNLYTFSLQETTSSTPICLMAKASPTQAWLWHRRLSYLNFDYINLLSKKDVVIGLPKLKYVKDQLCSSCEVSKAKRSSFKTKAVLSSKGRLNLLRMNLCGPMRVASINGKKYILVIIDDYSRYTWTLFLRSKDETPEVLKDFLTMIQQNLQAPSKGYRVYNKRTRLIVESIHLRFDEIKEITKTSVDNNTSGLVPQRQKASDYDNSSLVPQLQHVSPSADTIVPSQQELDLLVGPLYDEFFTAGTSSVNNSSSPNDNSKQQDTPPTTNIQSSIEPINPTNVNAEENNDNQEEDAQF
ncbi:retrovirus-related pol polyprotein from transposon TNT 1-94 [Tanacetum coccineum]